MRDGADTEEVRKAQVLDEGIIKWGKFLLALAGLLAAVILAAGGFDLYHAKEAAVDARMAAEKSKDEASASALTIKNEIDSAKNAEDTAKNEAARISYEARKLLDDTKKDVSVIEKSIQDSVVRIKQNAADIQFVGGVAPGPQTNEAAQKNGGLQNYGVILKDLQIRVAELEKKIAALEDKIGGHDQASQTKLPPPGEVEQTLAELKQTSRIEQTTKLVPGSDEPGTRQSWDVTLKLCSFNSGACGSDRLNEVSRVIYRFDKRWFSVPDVQTSDHTANFSYTVRVWGVTSVTACIFVSGAPDKPIVRSGRTSRVDDPAYWGPDSSALANACSDLHSL